MSRDDARLARLVAAGLSDPEIADAFGVSSRTILRWRKSAGLRSQWAPELQPCGTPGAYRRGCHCTDCRAANATAHRAWVRRRAYARWAADVP